MALPKWNLTPDQVVRADALGLRVMLAIMLKELIDSSPNREMTIKNLRGGVESVIASLPPPLAIPQPKQAEYLRCAVDSALRLIDNAVSVQKVAVPGVRH